MSIVVRPVRFTDQVDAMRGFCELLGLRSRIESERGGWVDLAGGAGLLALHAAAGSATGGLPGETRLSFEVTDADVLAASLRTAGYADATVVDESYGRVLLVTDPLGDPLQLDERQDDLYGYRHHDADPSAAAPAVVPVRFTDDAASYDRFLGVLGLVGTPDPGGYAAYACGPKGSDGFVGVHHVYGDDLPVVPGRGASVHLTLATRGDLDDVRRALEDGGFPVTRTDEDFGSFLDTTDPDGQSVQVHEWPVVP